MGSIPEGQQITPGGHSKSNQISLRLLGVFSVGIGETTVDVARGAERFLACIALLGGSANRMHVADTLWPDSPLDRRLANLRGVVWRLPESLRGAIQKVGLSIRLDDRWSVDLDRAVVEAAGLRSLLSPDAADRSLLVGDLLPDWDEQWLVIRRECHRQLRLHALEDLARAQLRAGRPLDAVDTALEAMAAEPLRESAQFVLICAHIAAGNRCAAIDQYDRFSLLLWDQLGVAPSSELQNLIATAQGQHNH